MRKYPIDPCPKCTNKWLPRHTCRGCIVKIEYEFAKREFDKETERRKNEAQT